jgi:putative membrane protein
MSATLLLTAAASFTHPRLVRPSAITHSHALFMRPPEIRMSELRPGSLKEARITQGRTPYGEESRRYRRTVYRHEDWLRHRSETRLLRNLQGTFTSGVVRSLLSEVIAVTTVALLVILWNGALFGYDSLSDMAQPGIFGENVPSDLRLSLPISIFTLSSPALGLLLVFRTNTSYQRWLEARQAWGRIVSHCRNIMRQATLWVDGEDDSEVARQSLEELSLCVWAFPRALWAHLSDPAKEPRFAHEVTQRFGDESASLLLDAPHRPLRALSLLSGAMHRLPIDEKKRLEVRGRGPSFTW